MAGKVYMAELKVIRSELGGFQTNCYIVANEQTGEAIVIDPSWNANYIYNTLKKNEYTCVGIYLTHGHVDHMAAMGDLKKLTGADTYASEDEKEVLGNSRSIHLRLFVISGYLPADAHTQNIRLNSNAARTADSIHVSSMDSSEFPVRMFLVWITSPAELSTMSTSLFPASIPRLSPSNDTECAE